MYSYPEDIKQKLEFDKILEKLSNHCLGEPARERVLDLRPFDKLRKIERMLDEIQEYQKSQDLGYHFPLSHYSSISDELVLLSKVDYVLDVEQYLSIYEHIRNISEIKSFFREGERAENLPLLFQISEQIEIQPEILKLFEAIFSEDGKIKPTASPELSRIFKAIGSKERELNKVFVQIVERYKRSGYLTDNYESVKNSRRVLSVFSEYKRKVKGVIHDESSTGKTVFIEPEEILTINNELFEFEGLKRQEIYRILRALSAELRPYLSEFDLWQKILIRYDVIRAKALFARTYNGKRPELTETNQLDLRNVFHPLLFLHNAELEKETIPFNCALNAEQRLLVISGPNAGGKSVTLKAAGLNQLMIQSGLLVPVDENSVFPVFQKIMIDIGDQQSIEGDLSTYSSRLLHMKHFVEQANKRTLILIDEFGSGSDPKIGGAIAEAILHKLVSRKCFGLITTHYSNIKNYAYKSKNILNGAMLFDNEALQPSYMLKVGQPGSSFAYELAKKIGMPEEILEYASKKTGKESETIDKLLIDLQNEKKALDETLLEAYDEKRRLAKLIENYEKMKGDLDIRRKKMKKEAKEKAYLNMSDAEKEIQKLIKKAKASEAPAELKDIAKTVKKLREDTREEIKDLSDVIFEEAVQKVKDLQVGQFVKLKSGGEAGKVIDFNDKKVKLEMGMLKFEVPRSEILLALEPINTKTKSVVTDTVNNPYAMETQLDIRGYSKSEAEASVQEFFDNALMSSVARLKILHGKGSGVLKKVVWSKAKEYKDIKKIWHPEEEFGGHGVSFVSF